MSETVIRVEHVSKQYRLGEIGGGSLREDINRWWSRRRGEAHGPIGATSGAATSKGHHWALRDVSFDIQRGDIVGIIGRNGAGKSTLLKLLSRITAPTEGLLKIRGRVGSLLEVGTGFHPELTGRENTYLNGAILGMRRREIDEHFDEIVEFSELGPFIDTPVKRYSSGMYVRLAFAVAAYLRSEILIVDEVLAVGDAAFQKKCLGKIKDVSSRQNRTVLFVTHNMAAVQSLCTRGLLLHQGSVAMNDSASRSIEAYADLNSARADAEWQRPADMAQPALRFDEISAKLVGRQPHISLHLMVELRSRESHRPAFIAFDILDSRGMAIMQALPTLNDKITSDSASHRLDVRIQLPPLIPGQYSITAWVGPHNTVTYDEVQRVVQFEIEASPTAGRSFPHHAEHGHIVPPSTATRISVCHSFVEQGDE